MRPTDVIDAVDRLIRGFQDAIKEFHFMHDPERTSLLGGTVIGQQNKDGVIEFTEISKAVDEPPNLVVGVIKKRSKGFLQATGKPPLIIGEFFPCLDTPVTGG
jgi:hypothetical protein